MNICLLGGAGFIGTNLSIALAQQMNNITIVSDDLSNCSHIQKQQLKNISCIESTLTVDTRFEDILKGNDVVYHLISSTVPTTSNQHISQELISNVVFTSNLLDACVRSGVKKVVFLSSGGTVYGKEVKCPIKEEDSTQPISSYGVQKITIEKLLYLYNYLYGLDYRIVRLGNPYGPYQRPNGILGAVTTFVYKTLRHEPITVYGDGLVIRDYIYIDDAVRGIINIADGKDEHKIFNLGCGYGTSIAELLQCIQETLKIGAEIQYTESRKVDVPVNYLDIGRYEEAYGKLNPIPLNVGIEKTADYLKNSLLY